MVRKEVPQLDYSQKDCIPTMISEYGSHKAFFLPMPLLCPLWCAAKFDFCDSTFARALLLKLDYSQQNVDLRLHLSHLEVRGI